MTNQQLEVLCLGMEKIEKKYPETYHTNKKWLALYEQREKLSKSLAAEELEYQKRKLDRLSGRDVQPTKTLIRQYEHYLKK